MTGYQMMACYRWEQKQLMNHFTDDMTATMTIHIEGGEEDKAGNIAWLNLPKPETPKTEDKPEQEDLDAPPKGINPDDTDWGSWDWEHDE
jgi:hypothetical protein